MNRRDAETQRKNLKTKTLTGRDWAVEMKRSKCTGQILHDGRFASNRSAVNRRCAASTRKMFSGNGITGNDVVQLVLCCTQVVADNFSKDGAIIVSSL